MDAPHRIVGGVLDSLLNIPKSISESISRPLDKLPLDKNGPHRMVDSVVKSLPRAVQTVGAGIEGALDKPVNLITTGKRKRKSKKK